MVVAQPMDPELKRALTIGGAAVAGVLVLVGIAIAVSSGDSGNETTSVQVPDRTSTSSSSTTSSSSSTTSTTLTPLTAPPTAPPTNPPTVIVIPPTTPPTAAPATAAPATPPTSPATSPGSTSSTSSSSTTTPTTRPEGEAALDDALELALNGGVPPTPGTPKRVATQFVSDDSGEKVRVTWKLDPTLTVEEQRVQSRLEAFTLLQAIQSAKLSTDFDPVVLRATLPDPETGDPQRIMRLVYARATLDSIFSTPNFDPLTIFTFANPSDIDPDLAPTPTTTSTT